MTGLRLENVSKRFGEIEAVTDVSLDLPSGAMITFLGPSGSGKSTLFRLVAGLEVLSSGRVFFGQREVTNDPPHKRNVGMVFQSHALFPHLRVWENIAYGLAIRGVPKAERMERAIELLELVKLPDVEQRSVDQLSGGQQQRVAIARALALQPILFLLDEPLSALDAKLREHMQIELRQLQKRVGVTTIVVTHDQREAMTMSDVVVVIDEGSVQQVGPPLEIYRKPANTFVAGFVGVSNLLDGHVTRHGGIEVGGHQLIASTPPQFNQPGAAVTICVRPEELSVSPAAPERANCLRGTASYIRDVGSEIEVYVDWQGEQIVCRMAAGSSLGFSVSDEVSIAIPEKVHLMATANV